MKPVVGIGRAGANDIGRVGGGVIGWLEVVVSETSETWGGTSRTSRVPTEGELESMGEVGVEMLAGNVASEVTVGGLNGGNT